MNAHRCNADGPLFLFPHRDTSYFYAEVKPGSGEFAKIINYGEGEELDEEGNIIFYSMSGVVDMEGGEVSPSTSCSICYSIEVFHEERQALMNEVLRKQHRFN